MKDKKSAGEQIEIYKEMAKQSDNVELKNIDGVPYVVKRGNSIYPRSIY